MERSYLKVGDRSSAGGIVKEGVPQVIHHGTEITFIGARVACPACNSNGVIAERGPRLPVSLMGKVAALDGDICVCKCDPPPVMIASKTNKTMSFGPRERAGMSFSSSRLGMERRPTREHWIQFSIKDAGSCEGLHCRAYFEDDSVEDGIFNFANKVRFERPNASACLKVDVVLGGNPTDSHSTTGNILMAMVG